MFAKCFEKGSKMQLLQRVVSTRCKLKNVHSTLVYVCLIKIRMAWCSVNSVLAVNLKTSHSAVPYRLLLL